MRHLALATMLLAGPAAAQQAGIGPETGRPLPRFESLRFEEVNLRRGASEDHPIAWKYRLYGLPVEIFQEFSDWRHVRDHDGSTGWIHKTQLGTARTVLVQEREATLRVEPLDSAKVVAHADPGVVLRLERCALDWCEAEVKGYRGWVRKTGLWGVRPGDVFEED